MNDLKNFPKTCYKKMLNPDNLHSNVDISKNKDMYHY